MGVLDFILDNSELRCAAGIALSPALGGFVGLKACEETIDKAVDVTVKAVEKSEGVLEDILFPGLPDFFRLDLFPYPKESRILVEALLPLPFRTFERVASKHLKERLESLSAEAQARTEETLFRAALSLMFAGPFFPIAVGLERYAYPIVPNVGVEDLGRFAAEVAMSAATLGVSRALAKGVKTAAEAAKQQKN